MARRPRAFATASSWPGAREATPRGLALSDRLIGVDWGASRARAFRFDAAGTVAERRERGHRLADGGFEAVLAHLAQGWAAPRDARFVLCGMVGSRQGWVEAAYLACPVDDRALAAAL